MNLDARGYKYKQEIQKTKLNLVNKSAIIQIKTQLDTAEERISELKDTLQEIFSIETLRIRKGKLRSVEEVKSMNMQVITDL